MNAVTLNEAKQNLEQLVERVIAGADSTIICTDSGQQVVLLPLEEFNSWKDRVKAQ
jgi:antitoxin YefM